MVPTFRAVLRLTTGEPDVPALETDANTGRRVRKGDNGQLPS
jgi:hypothetical protein